jgi:hypothetical protein
MGDVGTGVRRYHVRRNGEMQKCLIENMYGRCRVCMGGSVFVCMQVRGD